MKDIEEDFKEIDSKFSEEDLEDSKSYQLQKSSVAVNNEKSSINSISKPNNNKINNNTTYNIVNSFSGNWREKNH